MPNLLRNARKQAGITITELANKSGMSRATLDKIEKGHPIRYESAAKVVIALNQMAGTSYTVESLKIIISTNW